MCNGAGEDEGGRGINVDSEGEKKRKRKGGEKEWHARGIVGLRQQLFRRGNSGFYVGFARRRLRNHLHHNDSCRQVPHGDSSSIGTTQGSSS